MDYKVMKRDELAALCRERGIAFPAKATKAKLAELLDASDLAEPIEVEAVEIDDEIIPANVLAVDVDGMQRAAVELAEAIDAAATALGEYDVDDDVLDAMSVSDIRICEDGIAAALKNVDDRRKELTRMLTGPKKAIDEKCKEATVPLSQLGDRYKDARQSIYEKGYRAQYEDCCIKYGMERLLDLVPYEKLIAPHGQWVSRTANPVKTQEKIDAEVARIAKDWETLRGLKGSMRFYDEAEREFFATLDLNAAIDKNKTVTAQQERVDAMRREQEEAERWRAEQAAKRAQEPPAPAWTPVFEEVEPEPAQTPEPPAEPARAQLRRMYTFTAMLSDEEFEAFKKWKRDSGAGGNSWHCKAIDALAVIEAQNARIAELEGMVRNG
jgi:hypothetical protein